MILDAIVSPSIELMADFGPLVPEPVMVLEQGAFLFQTPLRNFDGGVQLVVPSLPTLLPRPPVNAKLLLHSLRDVTPLLDLPNLDDLPEGFVFLSNIRNTSLVQAFLSPIIVNNNRGYLT